MRGSATTTASPSDFSPGSSPGDSTSTILSDENHHSAVQPLNSHLESENQILKQQLSKAMQLSNDLDELNSKHALLVNQLRESDQRAENFQQRLRLSQQKNQDSTKRNRDLELSLKTVARERDELRIQFQEQCESSKNLQKVIDQNDIEKRTFFSSCSSLFGIGCESFPQILETFRRKAALNSEKAKAKLTKAEKEKTDIQRALDAAIAQLEKAQKQTSTLKKKALKYERSFGNFNGAAEANEKRVQELAWQLEAQGQQCQLLVRQNEELKEQNAKMNRIIEQLQQNRKQEKEKHQKLIKLRDERIDEMKQMSANPQHQHEIAELTKEVSGLKVTLDEAHRDIKEKQNSIEKLSKKLNTTVSCIEKMKCDRQSTKKRISQMKQVQKDLAAGMFKLRQENETLKQTNSKLEDECNHLKLQPRRDKPVYEPANDRAIQLLQPVIEQQNIEIEEYNRERKRLLSVIEKQSALVASCELTIQRLEQQHREVFIKREPTRLPKEPYTDLISLLRSRLPNPLQQILDDDDTDAHCRIELLCKEIADRLANSQNPDQLKQPMSARQLLTGESGLFEFLTSGTTLVDEIRSNCPRILPLFTGGCAERIQLLRLVQDEKWNSRDLFELLCRQVLINVSQAKEAGRFEQLLAEQRVWIDEFESAFPNCQIPDLLDEFQRLRARLKAVKLLKAKVRRMHQTQEYCHELEKQSEEQSERIAFLENSLRTLMGDLKTLQTHFESKSNQLSALEKSYRTLQSESSTDKAKLLEDLSNAEKTLNAQNQEYDSLFPKFAESQTFVKSLETSNEELRQKCRTLSDVVRKAKTEIARLKQEYQALCSSKRRENDAEINHLVSIQNDLKSKFSASDSSDKKQAKENQSMAEKVGQFEEGLKNANEENWKLICANKALQLQVQSLTDQMDREKEVIASQYRLRLIADDTRRQEEIAAIKAKHTQDMNAIVLTLVEEFEELGRFSVEDIRSAEFQKQIRRVGHIYRKLTRQSNM
jgi:chromosome segregation ATPase